MKHELSARILIPTLAGLYACFSVFIVVHTNTENFKFFLHFHIMLYHLPSVNVVIDTTSLGALSSSLLSLCTMMV